MWKAVNLEKGQLFILQTCETFYIKPMVLHDNNSHIKFKIIFWFLSPHYVLSIVCYLEIKFWFENLT